MPDRSQTLVHVLALDPANPSLVLHVLCDQWGVQPVYRKRKDARRRKELDYKNTVRLLAEACLRDTREQEAG